MDTRPHPTHHSGYRPNRALGGVVVALAGVFSCVFIAMVNTGDSTVLHVVKSSALWLGALAFVGGTVAAGMTELPHRFARCPSCRRLLPRSRIDFQQSYYPCRRCDVTWTCLCRKAGD